MMKKMAGAVSELSGTADISTVVRPAEFSAYSQFLMTEDGEKPLYVLKSKQDEYIWCPGAFVHYDGGSAVSSKRLVKRYSYHHYMFRDVRIETAGTVDLDCEIKFNLVPFAHVEGKQEHAFSLDVRKAELPLLTCLYKALTAIGEAQARAADTRGFAMEALGKGTEALWRGVASSEGKPAGEVLVATTHAAFDWQMRAQGTFVAETSNYAAVFDRYIRWA